MRFLALTALLISSTAFACPDLTGKYPVCHSTTGQSTLPEEMSITQAIVNGLTTYTVTAIDGVTYEQNTDYITPDGKEVISTETTEGGNVYTTKNIAYCKDNKVFMGMVINLNGQDVADVKIEVKKVGKALHQTSSGYAGNDDIGDLVVCE